MKNKKTKLFDNIKFVYGGIIRRDWILFVLSIFVVIFSSITYFTSSYILKTIIESLENKIPTNEIINTVIILSLIIAAILLFKELIDRICLAKWEVFFFNVVVDKNEKVMRMDYQLLEYPKTQDMIKKADQALGFYQGFGGIYFVIRHFIESILVVIIASFIVSLINPILLALIFVFVVCKYFATDKTNKLDKQKYIDVLPPYRRKAGYIKSISRNVPAGKDLRIYHMDEFIEKESKSVNEFIHQKFKESQSRWFKLEIFFKVLAILEEILLCGFLVWEVIEHGMSIGNFTFMLASIRTLSSSLSRAFNDYAKLRHYSRSTDDLRVILESDENSNKDCRDLEKVDHYTIEFKNVYFRYYSQSNYALENISFVLHENEKIALVGNNGAGKTTLIKLLCGLYIPEKGEILLNGVNINEYSKEDYFKLFAPVFQDVNTYAIDIGCNVSMDHESQTDYDKAYDSLVLAGLKTKITSLPLGLKTILSREMDSEGTDFSGGEKQKLALARAIYKESPVIILDEPTAALDALAEYNLYQNFNQIIKNRSAIYISHRLSSTRFCERIMLLYEGKIIETGSHAELMARDSEYKKVFEVQAQYYQDEVPNEKK